MVAGGCRCCRIWGQSTNQTMQTATALKAQINTLTGTEKAAALISAGYVRPNGKADFVRFYETLLAEKSGKDPVSERADLMLHFVNKWSAEYTIRDLKLAWETYSQQADIDGGYDQLDDFIDEYGLKNIGFYDSFADMVNDYDEQIVRLFVEDYGISCVSHFPESYQGTYSSEAAFAEDFCSQLEEIPMYAVVDWQATWDQYLRHDFSFDDETGAVFSQNF